MNSALRMPSANYQAKNRYSLTFGVIAAAGLAGYVGQVQSLQHEAEMQRRAYKPKLAIATLQTSTRSAPKLNKIQPSESLRHASIQFAASLLENSETLGTDFSKVIEDNFFDLLIK